MIVEVEWADRPGGSTYANVARLGFIDPDAHARPMPIVDPGYEAGTLYLNLRTVRAFRVISVDAGA